jgi:hypothetical protein
MAYVPPALRKQQAAMAALTAPAVPDVNPVFAQVPQHDWGNLNYQYTLTIQWGAVAVPGLPAITVRAHVHYRWQPPGVGVAGQWVKFGGNAWISGMNNWSTPTPPVVVNNLAPVNPPNINYHA